MHKKKNVTLSSVVLGTLSKTSMMKLFEEIVNT